MKDSCGPNQIRHPLLTAKAVDCQPSFHLFGTKLWIGNSVKWTPKLSNDRFERTKAGSRGPTVSSLRAMSAAEDSVLPLTVLNWNTNLKSICQDFFLLLVLSFNQESYCYWRWCVILLTIPPAVFHTDTYRLINEYVVWSILYCTAF